jgi:predicted neuraminidase
MLPWGHSRNNEPFGARLADRNGKPLRSTTGLRPLNALLTPHMPCKGGRLAGLVPVAMSINPRRTGLPTHNDFLTKSPRPIQASIVFMTLTVIVSAAPADDKQPPKQAGKILLKEFIFDSVPFASCHASTIVEGSRGLVAAWFGGKGEGKPDVGIWLSRRVHGAWTAPVEVATGVVPGERRFPCWNPVLFQPGRAAKEGSPIQNKPLMLFYKVGPSPQSWWGMLATSQDGGAIWAPPQRLPKGILGPIKNKPVELAGGEILCPTSTESAEKPSRWRVCFERTADLGATWTKTEYLNDGVAVRAIQPSILKLGRQELLALGRTTQGKIFRAASHDDGKTWGKLELTSLPNPNSGIDAVTLKDGRNLLVYNPTIWERSPLCVAVSGNGMDWKSVAVLENDAGEYSYPAVIQSADGLVHITYTWRREKIRHVVLDPAQIAAQAK